MFDNWFISWFIKKNGIGYSTLLFLRGTKEKNRKTSKSANDSKFSSLVFLFETMEKNKKPLNQLIKASFRVFSSQKVENPKS